MIFGCITAAGLKELGKPVVEIDDEIEVFLFFSTFHNVFFFFDREHKHELLSTLSLLDGVVDDPKEKDEKEERRDISVFPDVVGDDKDDESDFAEGSDEGTTIESSDLSYGKIP